MGIEGFVRGLGIFFLFVAFALLVVTSISGEFVDHDSLLTVQNFSYESQTSRVDKWITFGNFGYCIRNGDDGNCYHTGVGYDPVSIILETYPNNFLSFSESDRRAARALTRAFVLHPVAAGLALVAFVTAALTERLGSVAASAASFLAFAVALAPVACDFAAFGIVRDAVERSDQFDVAAYRGTGADASIVALLLLFVSGAILFVTCCSARRGGYERARMY
ncbi:hypothetical protein BX600DRAFT_539705 [Xylariales sp. PMI_506]|nr:hypothetical protein BX600DRAFT_539705 [Xylariales sp. PMI_506]